MLLQFTFTNHASFRDEQTFSLIADRSHRGRSERPIPGSRHRTVSAAAIYGANASGKSKLIDAITWMRSAVLDSFSRWSPASAGPDGKPRQRAIPRTSFKLRPDAADYPSEYVVDFVVEDIRYQYGFSCDDQRILGEWLTSFEKGPARRLFSREPNSPHSIRFGRTFSGPKKSSEAILRENSLFLSVAAASNHPLLRTIYTWFEDSLLVASDYDYPERLDFTLHGWRQHHGPDGGVLRQLLNLADTGIGGLEFQERKLDPAAEKLLKRVSTIFEEETGTRPPFEESQTFEVWTQHQTKAGDFRLPLGAESHGSQTWIGLLGPVLEALENGATLCVDELDAHLHPILTDTLVNLFQDASTNPNGAQLVFNSHATGLLGSSSRTHLRRDQIWFTQKDLDSGATELYPMTDIDVRDRDVNLERRYLAGRFGSTPLIQDELRSSLAKAVARSENAPKQSKLPALENSEAP